MGVAVRRYIDILIIGERSEPPLSVELSEFSLYLYIFIYLYISGRTSRKCR